VSKVTRYDVFLSYNRADEAAVEALARRLREEAGLNPFLDRWHLVPGEPWQEALEAALDASQACAVCLGPAGLGTWENEEMRAALDLRTERSGFRVIPVLLPGAALPERGRLPRFLARLTWVDFRPGLDDADAFHRLSCGVQGIAPGAQEVVEAACPFRGLEVFDEEHAPFFFGREALTQYLVEQLRRDRFLAVIGPSGSGKSSVVRAGLLPQVRAGALAGSKDWPVVVLKPGPHPLETLAARLLPHMPPGADPLAARQTLLETLRQDERGLHNAVQVALAAAPDDRRLLLLVDQFEEVFTLCQGEDERAGFIANLLYASAIAGGQAVVALTLRADFYGKCAHYPALAGRLERNVLVGPLRAAELRRAVEGPAEVVGLNYEKGLVDTILEDLGDEPGALPLLQHTLWELWQRRRGQWLTFDAYREIGGVQGALAHRAEEVYAGFSQAEQGIARRVLLRLTQPGEGTDDTRRRAEKAELVPEPGGAAEIEGVVQQLAAARLLATTRDEESGEEMVDVAHEALIRGWPRLQGWIGEDRAGLLTHRRLTEAAEEWERNGKDRGYLYAGGRLAEVSEWAGQHTADLNPLEKDFIQRSTAARQRTLWQRIGLAAAAVLLLVGAALLFALLQRDRAVQEGHLRSTAQAESTRAILAEGAALDAQRTAQAESTRAIQAERTAQAEATRAIQAEQEAQAQARAARSRQLAAQSQLLLTTHPQRSLLLAVESLGVLEAADPWPPSAANALRQALANTGGIPLRDGGEQVQILAVDPLGRYVATGSADGLVRLWSIANLSAGPAALHGQTGSVSTLAFRPDGRYLASGSADGTVNLWDVEQPARAPMVFKGHTAAISAVAFGPDGRYLASASEDSTACLWDLGPAAAAPALSPPTVLRGHTGAILALAISPDGRFLATAGADRTARLWDMAGPAAEPLVFGLHEDRVTAVAFSPNSEYLATRNDAGSLWIWSLADPAARPAGVPGFEFTVATFAFSPADRYLAAGGADGTIRLWDLHTAAEPTVLTAHREPVYGLQFSPDGRTLASGGNDGTIHLWDVTAAPVEVAVLRGHDAALRQVAFGPDGRTLASRSTDGVARLWNLDRPAAEPAALETFGGRELAVDVPVAFSPDGRYLASGGCLEGQTFYCSRSAVLVWDLADSTRGPIELDTGTGPAADVAFSPDGRILAAGGEDDVILLWSVADLAAQPTALRGHTADIVALAFSPDGHYLATGGRDSTARLWDMADLAAAPAVLSHGSAGAAQPLAFSRDSRYLATGSPDGTVRLWQVADPRAAPAVLRGHTRTILAIAFSPDGRHLVTTSEYEKVLLWALPDLAAEPLVLRDASIEVQAVVFSPGGRYVAIDGGWNDPTVQLWDMEQLAAGPVLLRGDVDDIAALALSPDGRFLVTGAGWIDPTMRMWDIQDPQAEPAVLPGHTGQTTNIAWSPDGRYLATGAEYMTVRLYTIGVNGLVELACRTAGRNLTPEEWDSYFAGQPYRPTCPQWP